MKKQTKNKMMSKVILCILFVACCIMTSVDSYSQGAAVNTTGASADQSAMLDVSSSTQGMLVPRMTEAQKIAIVSPANGLLIYQTDNTSGFWYYNGSGWVQAIGVTGATGSTGFASTVPGPIGPTGPNGTNGATGPTGSVVSGKHIGELYGGGVIFYVDSTGYHGLICSMVGISTSTAWSSVTSTSVPGGALSWWDGKTNSTNIIAQSSTSAANLCKTYTNTNYGTGSYNDWYLPSIGELNYIWDYIYQVQKSISGSGYSGATTFAAANYWASTEYSASTAWYFNFTRGYAYSGEGKSVTYYVRAVRAF